MHGIERSRNRHGHTGDRFHDQNILRSVHPDIAVPQDADILFNLRILVLHDGVALLAVIRRDLREAHLANVAGHGRLGHTKTGQSKFLDQLFLRLDLFLTD